ncbi:hypothetical protein SCHPADRAFT_1000662 [Schizopora paradoxa]|uniref:MYND-type domain-containing protein n=1 Tax=Schizopora paradoxa TaxID=27342 RepID=A0A0H2RH65_9AGAM|nr:hypothetical protein SCHPADRAFT_1000662 [Schizopora paradoxa]
MSRVGGRWNSLTTRWGSQNVQMYMGFGRTMPMPEVDVEVLIEASRRSLDILLLVVINLHAFPARLQAETLKVFFSHLRTPVEQQLCEKDEPYEWIMASLQGIQIIGRKFFQRDAASRQRFIDCWPHILKWLKALLVVRDEYEERRHYSEVVGEIYTICSFACPGVLGQDEVIKLAFRAWIGIEGRDGKDHYTVQPLLACLLDYGGKTNAGALHMERMLQACDNTAEDLLDKIAARLEQATIHSSPMNIREVIALSSAMGSITYLGQSFTVASLRASVGRSLVAVLKALLEDKEISMNHIYAVRSILAGISGCLSHQKVDYAYNVAEEGILILLAKAALFDTEPQGLPPLHCASLAADILKHLLLCFIYNDEMIEKCREEVRGLYAGNLRFKDMLDETPKSFRETWDSFEAMLLENALLLRLFEMGYAPENGTCANRDCRVLARRTRFKKCAGCTFALYCSSSCQKADWGYHRTGCKALKNDHLSILRDRYRRLPRRVVALHINRYWDAIVRLSLEKGVPSEDLAVRITWNAFPIRVEVFDWHRLLEDVAKNPHLILAAENLYGPEGGRREWILVVLRMEGMEFPCIVHLDNKLTKSVQAPPCMSDTEEPERASFVDEDGNAIDCAKLDALRAGVLLAKSYADETGESVWDGAILRKAADKIIEEFEQELCEGEDAFKIYE